MERCFFIFLFLASFSAHATGINFELSRTSDQIHSRSVSFDYAKKKEEAWSFGYLAKQMQFRQDVGSNRGTAHRAFAGYSWKISPEDLLFVSAGANYLKIANADTTKVVGSVQYRKTMDSWQITASSERRSLVEDTRNTSKVSFFLMDQKSKIGSTYRIAEKWKAGAGLGHSYLSDSNSALLFDSNVQYGISESWPWIWAGYGIEGMRYRENKVGYWSPRKFLSHGPRLDMSFGIYEKLSGIIAFNYNFHRENGTKGSGFLGGAGLQWGQWDGNHFRLIYSKIRSRQNQSPWIYEGLQLTCNIIGL